MKEKSKDIKVKKRSPAVETTPNPTTDPQESMEGPVSSVIQKIKEGAEKRDDKEQQEHEHKKNHTGGDFINK